MLNISLGDVEKGMKTYVTILAKATKLLRLAKNWLPRVLGNPYKSEWLVFYIEFNLQF